MTTISSTHILSSHNVADPNPDRNLVTILNKYPLWIHQELLTHRAFSRNTASSRAIPIKRMIEAAQDDPAMPIHWYRNEPGMQGYQPMSKIEIDDARDIWLRARDSAVLHALHMSDTNAHKQLVNRLLGPFIHTIACISATEWSNFFGVRLHHSTEPHMRDLAQVILAAVEKNPVQQLQPQQWHLPFIQGEDMEEAHKLYDNPEFGGSYEDILIPLSVARAASTSYKTVDNLHMTSERANALYSKLVAQVPLHASPAEHVAQADGCVDYYEQILKTHKKVWLHPQDHRNFVGFCQQRSMLKDDTL